MEHDEELVHDLPDGDSVTTSGGTSGAKRARPDDEAAAAAPEAAGAHLQKQLHTGKQVAPQQVPTLMPPMQYAHGKYYPPGEQAAGPPGAPQLPAGAYFAPPGNSGYPYHTTYNNPKAPSGDTPSGKGGKGFGPDPQKAKAAELDRFSWVTVTVNSGFSGVLNEDDAVMAVRQAIREIGLAMPGQIKLR